MKRSYFLPASLGLALGAGAAWLVARTDRQISASPAAASLGQITESGRTLELSSAAGKWKALQSSGLRGLPRHLAFAALIAKTSSQDIGGLLKLTEDDPGLRELLLRRWVALDPFMAADWLAPRMIGDDADFNGHDDDITIAFSAWAERDPEAVIASIRSKAGEVPGMMYSFSVMARLLRQDMAAGIRFGSLTGSSENLERLIWTTGGSDWVEKDPAKAASLLSGLPAGEFRDVSLRRAIAELSIGNLEAAIDLQRRFPDLAGQPGGPQPDGRTAFYEQWAKKDLAGITAFVNEKARGETRHGMKAAIAKAIGETDPESGLAWAAENLSGSRRHEAVKAILTKMTRDNPEGALRYLDTMPDGTALDRAVQSFSEAFPSGQFADLLAKAGALPEGAARQKLTATAYGQWYQKEPEVLLHRLAGEEAANLPAGLWGSLGRNTPSIEDGVKRLESIPPAAAAEFIKSLCQSHFGMNDPLDKMTAGVARFQNPEHRAAAIEVLARQSLWRGSEALVTWAAQLPAASERKIVADQIMQNQRDLTPQERARLVAPLR